MREKLSLGHRGQNHWDAALSCHPPPPFCLLCCVQSMCSVCTCLHIFALSPLSAHASASIRHSFMAKRFFTPHAPRAMESKELVPAVPFFRYHDYKKGPAKKEAWNTTQKTASRLMTHPLPLRKQLIAEAERQADSEFRLLPFGLKILQPMVAARFPCQKPRIGFSLLQEAYRLAHLCLDPQSPQSAVSTPRAKRAAIFGSLQGSATPSTPTSGVA